MKPGGAKPRRLSPDLQNNAPGALKHPRNPSTGLRDRRVQRTRPVSVTYESSRLRDARDRALKTKPKQNKTKTTTKGPTGFSNATRPLPYFGLWHIPTLRKQGRGGWETQKGRKGLREGGSGEIHTQAGVGE